MSARQQHFKVVRLASGGWQSRIIFANGKKGWGTQHTYYDKRTALRAIELLPGFSGWKGPADEPVAASFGGRLYAVRYERDGGGR